MKAKCVNCESEFHFYTGKILMACQKCGCQDLRFDSDLLLIPVAPSGELGRETPYLEGEPFYGIHDKGSIWEVRMLPSGEKVEIPIPPKEEVEQPEVEQQKEKKPVLAKPLKRLRTKVGP